MPFSYIFLSFSFVFLFLAMDALVKKDLDNVGRFVCISLIANLVAMFSFVFPNSRTASSVESEESKGAICQKPARFMASVNRREDIHSKMNEDLDSMNEMTTNMLVNLGEIKGMLLCLDREKYPPFVGAEILPLTPIIQDSDLGLSSEDADSGAGVSSDTPK